MPKQAFAPKTDNRRALWLKNFASKLAQYAAKYGLNADEVKDMLACTLFFKYWLDYQNMVVDYDKKVTTYKNQMRDNVPAGALPPIQPDAPDPGDIPPVVEPGIFSRAYSLALRIKKHKAYTIADGEDLGIEGAAVEEPDLRNIQPIIKVVLGKSGHPDILWPKGKMDGVDIYVDRGTGTWTFLAIDTYPDYTDMAPLPAPGQSAYWQYRCLYRFDDETVGQWSNIAGISVTG